MADEQRDSVDEAILVTIREQPYLDPDVEAAAVRIGRLSRYLQRLWERTAEEFDLNAGGYDVLLSLLQANGGMMTPGALAKDCLISTGAMTKRLDRLESQGYAARVRDTKDRRSVKVHITPAGVEVLDRALRKQGAAEARVLGVLEIEDLSCLNDTLRKVMISFETKEGER